MNWLKVLVGFSAIIIAGCAAYFSVTGLGVLFAGASIPVMVMAGSLEFAKLTTATYLKQKWNDISGFNKWYLTISVGVLMIITSAGIFGYLSNAFQQQNLSLQKVEREIAVYQTQITKNDAEINRFTTQINNLQQIRNSQEQNISKIVERNGSTSRLTQMVRNADAEIKTISKRIDELTI
jgi:glucose dehydrogenase